MEDCKGMKRLVSGKSRSKPFVRARKEKHEEKLEVAKLRENLVHEEFIVDVKSVYDFSHGKDAKEVGGFGEVQAVSHRKTGTMYAMKTVKLSGVKNQKAFEFVMKEVDLLKSLDHPNIVRLQEVYMSETHLHMAMDLITGGNLAGGFKCGGEDQAAVIVRQIIRALRYLHDRNIAHRDLKLENILIEKGPGDSSTPAIKLVDFGLSAIYQENGVSTDVLGSWNYVAPEVIKGQYRPAPADMWSLGVVAYVLMSRKLPFDADDTDDIKRNILSARFAFKGKAWAQASESSKHFVRSLLIKNARLRLTAAGAQEHEWLSEAEDMSQTPRTDSKFRENVTQSLLDFREANPMKRLALEVVARTLDPGQISHLAEEFDHADNNNNGEVSLVEFERWLEANGAARGMTDEDVQALFRSVDVDNSGHIHFNEFLAATIQQRHMDEAQLRPAFDRLDRSHTGFINLEDVTLTTGAAANKEESAVLVGYFDMNGDGQISFEEFVNGMRRMGGSARDGGGLLSISPRAAVAPPAAFTPSNQPTDPAEKARDDEACVSEREDRGSAVDNSTRQKQQGSPTARDTKAGKDGERLSEMPDPETRAHQLDSPTDGVSRGHDGGVDANPENPEKNVDESMEPAGSHTVLASGREDIAFAAKNAADTAELATPSAITTATWEERVYDGSPTAPGESTGGKTSAGSREGGVEAHAAACAVLPNRSAIAAKDTRDGETMEPQIGGRGEDGPAPAQRGAIRGDDASASAPAAATPPVREREGHGAAITFGQDSNKGGAIRNESEGEVDRRQGAAGNPGSRNGNAKTPRAGKQGCGCVVA